MMENMTSQPAATKKSGKSNRGFASMDPQRHKEISSRGGRSSRRPASSNGSNRLPAETTVVPS